MAMEATFVQEGHLIDWPISPTAIAAGEVIVVNNVCFVARQPIPANTPGAMAATGVYDVLKTAGLVIPAGVAVFWNDTTNRATLTTSDVYMGVAIRSALSGDATVRVHLRSLQELVAGQFGLPDLSDVGVATPTAGNLLIGDGDSFEAGKLGAISLANSADGGAGVPILIRKTCTAAGAGDVTVLASAPVKLLITDAWMVARDTQAANVKLHSGTAGTDDITAAKAKGTASDAIVRFDSIVAAKDEVAAGGAIKANFSAAGAADVFVLAVPIA